MKKKLFGAIFALAVMVATGYGVNKRMQHDADLSDMALSNVEALAEEHINPLCPNGCIDEEGGCYCYGDYPQYKEYDWDAQKDNRGNVDEL